MRRWMLPAVLSAILIFAMVGGAADAASAKVKKPSANVTFGTEVEIVGANFKPKEHVTATLSGASHTWTKKGVASVKGAFTIDLGHIGLNECNAFTLKVVGSLKSRVSVSHATEPC